MSSIVNRVLAAATAAVVICGLAGCMANRRSAEDRQADRDMADRVQTTLASDQMLYSRHISVRAEGGIVTLDGYTWTPEEMQAAVQDAEQVSGVTKVVNRIEIDRGAIQDSGVAR